jgi:hypothetical protein
MKGPNEILLAFSSQSSITFCMEEKDVPNIVLEVDLVKQWVL